MSPVVEMRGISKRFPGVVANDRVDLRLEPGEIHALLGENGAGKTTLMNILYGLVRPDAGEILVRGGTVRIARPGDAIRLGIGMVHQHFMLIPVMTVAENIMLGNESTRLGPFLDGSRAAARVRELCGRYGLEVDPAARVDELPIGVRQRVEILKALYRDAEVLILDEPTAVLTEDEADSLFHTFEQLKNLGKSIVFITHKLREVMTVADRITVLRGGRVVGTTTPADTSKAELASLMVGRDVALAMRKKPATPGSVVLRVDGLHVTDNRGAEAVRGVSFDLRQGEVLGIAGVQGNGQTELVEALTGLRRCTTGRIEIGSVAVSNRSPRAIADEGVAHIPEDRHRHGIVEVYSIADNLVLNAYNRPPFSRNGVMIPRAIREYASRLVEEFDIRTPGTATPGASLSGGNQQKMVVAREFSRPIRLLILAHPTRGLDVGSAEFIHRRIIERRDRGCAVLLVSAELDEILALSDRVAVMYRGRLVATVQASRATREALGLWMAGIEEKPAQTAMETAVADS